MGLWESLSGETETDTHGRAGRLCEGTTRGLEMEKRGSREELVVRELEGGGRNRPGKDRKQQKQKNRDTVKGRDQKGKPRERDKRKTLRSFRDIRVS